MSGDTREESLEDRLDSKRDLLYAGTSLLSISFLILSWNSLESIEADGKFPFEMIGYIVTVELVKVLLGLGLFPASPTSYYSPRNLEFLSFLENTKLKLPLINTKRDHASGDYCSSESESQESHLKILEGVKGILGFLFAVGICHLVLVLFGAPLIQDWLLTLEFSVILATWLFIPFLSILPPSSVVIHLFYISAWGKLNPTFLRYKWRYISTIFGAWVGAVVIPLDWDEPWQRWPIPCYYSLTCSQFLIHLLYFSYLSFSLYSYKLTSRKTKSY